MQEKERMLLYVIAGIAVVILLVSIITGFLIVKKMNQIAVGREKPAFVEASAEVGPTYDLGEFTVNLANPKNYLRANIVLELNVPDTKKSEEMKKELEKEVTKRDPQIRDVVVRTLSSQEMVELGKPAGKEKLKKLLRAEIEKVMGKDKIKNVYFTSFAMQ